MYCLFGNDLIVTKEILCSSDNKYSYENAMIIICNQVTAYI